MIIRIQAEPVVPGLKRGIVNVETFRSADKGGAGSGPGGSTPYGSMRMSPDGHDGTGLSLRRTISRQCDQIAPTPILEGAERSFVPKGC